jgi:hypothetical protein
MGCQAGYGALALRRCKIGRERPSYRGRIGRSRFAPQTSDLGQTRKFTPARTMSGLPIIADIAKILALISFGPIASCRVR